MTLETLEFLWSTPNHGGLHSDGFIVALPTGLIGTTPPPTNQPDLNVHPLANHPQPWTTAPDEDTTSKRAKYSEETEEPGSWKGGGSEPMEELEGSSPRTLLTLTTQVKSNHPLPAQ